MLQLLIFQENSTKIIIFILVIKACVHDFFFFKFLFFHQVTDLQKL